MENNVGKRKRNWEYLSVIQENINHPSIKRVVLFYTDPLSLAVWSYDILEDCQISNTNTLHKPLYLMWITTACKAFVYQTLRKVDTVVMGR